MYPDTDSPPTRVTESRVAALKAGLKPTPWSRIDRYSGWRVPEETSRFLIRRGGAEIVDAVVEKTGVDGLTAAMIIGQRAKALKRAGVPVERLGAGEWIDVFELLATGRIAREAVPVVATRMAKDGLSASSAAEAEGIALVGREAWSSALCGVTLDGYLDGRLDSRDRRVRFLSGRAVQLLKGRAPAKDVAAYVQDRLEEIVR
jgi:glutamyl-tRNA(Gln) amidotransferase subunit E